MTPLPSTERPGRLTEPRRGSLRARSRHRRRGCSSRLREGVTSSIGFNNLPLDVLIHIARMSDPCSQCRFYCTFKRHFEDFGAINAAAFGSVLQSMQRIDRERCAALRGWRHQVTADYGWRASFYLTPDFVDVHPSEITRQETGRLHMGMLRTGYCTMVGWAFFEVQPNRIRLTTWTTGCNIFPVYQDPHGNLHVKTTNEAALTGKQRLSAMHFHAAINSCLPRSFGLIWRRESPPSVIT